MRYDVFADGTPDPVILVDVPMLVLVHHDFIESEQTQDVVLSLHVGEEYPADKEGYTIRRAS